MSIRPMLRLYWWRRTSSRSSLWRHGAIAARYRSVCRSSFTVVVSRRIFSARFVSSSRRSSGRGWEDRNSENCFSSPDTSCSLITLSHTRAASPGVIPSFRDFRESDGICFGFIAPVIGAQAALCRDGGDVRDQRYADHRHSHAHKGQKTICVADAPKPFNAVPAQIVTDFVTEYSCQLCFVAYPQQ